MNSKSTVEAWTIEHVWQFTNGWFLCVLRRDKEIVYLKRYRMWPLPAAGQIIHRLKKGELLYDSY